MAEKKEYPEHVLQVIDLVVAILRRINAKALDKSQDGCLYIGQAKEVKHA